MALSKTTLHQTHLSMATSEHTSTKVVKTKKDKSSKKRKAEAITETASVPDGVASPDSSKEDSSDSPQSKPETTANTNGRPDMPATKKRKASVEEIEVDVTLPEPPSKKALRRLKKGKPLPPSKSGAETTPEPEEKAKKAEVEKRSEHGIWIGNLAFHVSKDDLSTFFTDKSDLTEAMITRVHMPGPNDKKSANKVEEKKKYRPDNNKGYAYVDFSSKEAVDMAVELCEELLMGRRVLIKDNKSFEGRPEKTKAEIRMEGKPPSKRVFLGNLSFDTSEDSLKDHFEKCGAIESVKVATFEDTGKCKGYAWIVFEELSAAESAVRGFVMVEEEDSDASDSEDESAAGSDEEVVSKSKPKKKTKLRKWWINKIKGRPLRMEFAEEAAVRYKKRYGSGGTKNPVSSVPRESAGDEVKEVKPIAVKKVEYRKPYAARLTGGIVESKGKKVVF